MAALPWPRGGPPATSTGTARQRHALTRVRRPPTVLTLTSTIPTSHCDDHRPRRRDAGIQPGAPLARRHGPVWGELAASGRRQGLPRGGGRVAGTPDVRLLSLRRPALLRAGAALRHPTLRRAAGPGARACGADHGRQRSGPGGEVPGPA